MSSPAAEKERTPTVTPRQTMRGHTDMVRGVAHLPDGQHIITCSKDGSLRLWDLESGAQIGKWSDGENNAGVRTMALSPNGKTVASGSDDGTVRLWDVGTGNVTTKWTGHSSFVECVCWSLDGERVMTGSNNGTARVWHVQSGKPVRMGTIKTGHKDLYVVSFSPNATKIATGGFSPNGSAIKIWDPKRRELLKIKHDPVWSLAWSSDEKKLISGSDDGSIRIFDTATWQEIAVLEGHTLAVTAITLYQNDRLLASTSWDYTARLWNLDTNLPVGPPLQHKNDLNCAAFSADGNLLAAACRDHNAYVWDIRAILKAASSENLLSPPDIHSRLSQDTADKSFLEADATRRPDQLGDADDLSVGFFDDIQDNVHSFTMLGARRRSNSSALLGRLSLFLHRSD